MKTNIVSLHSSFVEHFMVKPFLIHNVRNMKNIILNSIIFSMFLCSCNGEFSKYQKKGENDLEGRNLVGNVKSVSEYYDGELQGIDTYNKYGFYEERIDYDDGEISEKTTYTYNEFGKVTRKEIKNKKFHKAELAKYDEYGNCVEESEEVYEVFDASSDVTVGRKLLCTYENSYDKLGGLIKCRCLNRNGTCKYECEYNQDGNLSKRTEYREDGSVSSYTDYSYRGNVLAKEKTTYPDVHEMYRIVYYNQFGEMVKQADLFEDGSVHEIYEYVLDDNGYCLKEICTWVVSPWLSDALLSIRKNTDGLKPGERPGDVCHRITQYYRDEHGSILKMTETNYNPDEDMSTPKKADETYTSQYKYDTHGNVIYEKNNEGHEHKYEITYY